ncbi:hypothetical protein ACO0LM_23870 [Undibacterium sp. Di26W]|uniref:hypothetical protein n=1 Tax=Undibacterium sp. Di26W TaxID=3413035 RepID=UPI003BF24F29
MRRINYPFPVTDAMPEVSGKSGMPGVDMSPNEEIRTRIVKITALLPVTGQGVLTEGVWT